MPRITGAGGEGVQAVVLALRILEHLAHDGRPVGVTALARALGTTKSRIHRHLQTLAQEGYILQAATRAVPGRRGSRPSSVLRGHVRPGERRTHCAAARHAVPRLPKWNRRNPRLPRCPQVVRGDRHQARSSCPCGSAQEGWRCFRDESRGRTRSARASNCYPENHRQPGPAQEPTSCSAGAGGRPNEALIGVNALAAPVFGATARAARCTIVIHPVHRGRPTAEQVEQVRGRGGGFRPRSVTRARAVPGTCASRNGSVRDHRNAILNSDTRRARIVASGC
jgi:hypothetical protein